MCLRDAFILFTIKFDISRLAIIEGNASSDTAHSLQVHKYSRDRNADAAAVAS